MHRMSEESFAMLGWISSRVAELQEEQQELAMLSQLVNISELEKPVDQFNRPYTKEQISELKNELKTRLTKAKSKAKN